MIILQSRIYRADLQANPGVLYLFGDNQERVGLGGQAKEMRGEPNAVGVATKKRPTNEDSAFFTDDEFSANQISIYDDLEPVREHLLSGGTVVIPLDGLGTGLSDMPNRCPQTFAYLERQLASLEAQSDD